MGIGCLALRSVEADFGILRMCPNLGSQHSLLDHMDLVDTKEEFVSVYETDLKEQHRMRMDLK